MTKKILAIILAFILLFQAVPMQVFATGGAEEPIPEGGEIIIPDGEVEGEDAALLAAENPGDNSRDHDRTGKPTDLSDDVYVAVYDGTGFPGEPAWYPQDNYTFIKLNNRGAFAQGSPYANSAEDVLSEDVLENLTQGPTTDGVRVWGHYSATGTNTYILDDNLTDPEKQAEIIELVTGRNAEGYKIIWYVVKYQTDTYWHIDGLIVKDNTYNVNYYGNGNTSGNAPTGAKNLPKDYEYTVLGNAGNLKKDGYTFNGWNTQADGEGTPYAPGDKITITGDVSLYAQWVPNKIEEITVTKVWEDNNDQDGIRPQSVTVHLLANGAHDTSRRVTLTADKNWSASWENLPTVDRNGRSITYTVEEEAVSGYSSNVTGNATSGFTITNTHNPATTTVQAQKVWDDDHDRDGMRPTSVTLQIYKQVGDGDAVAVTNGTLEAKPGNSWTAQWHNLPKYEAGQLITYSVKEVGTYTGYTAQSAVDPHTGVWQVTNTYTSEKTAVTVTKVWEDNEDQDGIRPESVTVNLLADGKSTGKSVVLSEANNWSHTFTELSMYAGGKEVAYTVIENAVTGYATKITGDAETGFTIANTHTPEKTSISVTKVWDDADNQDHKRPASVTVNLLADGEAVAGKTVELNSENQWTAKFENLDKFSNGEKIEYTVQENTVDGYTAKVTGTAAGGYTITNSYTPETTEVTITKVWEDANNQDGKRPTSITVAVLAGNAVVKTAVLRGTGNTWTATVTGLPKFVNGVEIEYVVQETDVPDGYESSVNGYTITNTHTPATTEVTVTKKWDHKNNQSWNHPESITLHLLADGEHDTTRKVTLHENTVQKDAAGNWLYTWSKLPEYANGHKIQYTVAEESVTSGRSGIYTVSYSHDPENPNKITVTNTYDTSNNTSIYVEKIWDDADNQDGMRPDGVIVTLYKQTRNDSEPSPVRENGRNKVINLTSNNGWEGAFNNLPKRDNRNRTITYSVKETGYTVDNKTYSGIPAGYQHDPEKDIKEDDKLPGNFIITNRRTPATTSVSIEKVWNDANNQDGIRPDSITVNLKADGTVVDTLTLTKDNWTGTFTDLPKNAGGNPIEYTVEEVAVEGYTSSAITGDAETGFTITNTHTPATTSVTVNKVWGDADNQDGIRPGSVEVTLFADGTAVGEPVELTAEGNWNHTFQNLDKFKAGKAIEYTVEETVVTGYAPVITGTAENGYTITNTHTPEEIDIPVTKVWDDAQNQDGKRPGSITVTLKADGEEAGTLTLSADNNWQGKFENLPKKAAGQEIVYTVAEEQVDGYDAPVITGSAATGYTITNTHVVEETELTVIKVWDDGNNQDGTRPLSVEFHLLADGVHTGSTITLTGDSQQPDGTWTHTWKNLPKYAAGKEIGYIVYESNQLNTEDGVLDVPDVYDVSYVRDSKTQITVTNSYTPETTTVTAVKVWDDGDDRDNLRPDSITVGLYIGEEPVKDNAGQPMTKILNLANGWSDSWTDLPKNANGNEIAYTVKEISYTIGDVTTEGIPAGYEHLIEKDEYDPEEDAEEDAQVHANVITNEFIITNTHKPATTEVTVTKEWDDAGNQDGIRPKSVEVVLFRNGTAFGDHVVLNAENSWTYTFEDLFVYDGRGGLYTYTVVENTPDGYEAVVTGDVETGFTITNKHTPEVTSVTVTKTWADANDQDGLRPEEITVNLLDNNGTVVRTAVMSANAQDEWKHTFTDLPKYADGEEIVYTVQEAEVDGYTPDINGYTITNTHAPEMIDELKVTKVWDDADNQDGIRPDSITVTLYANGDEVKDLTLTAGEDGKWTGVFEDLPKYAGGVEIEYTVEEESVEGYDDPVVTGSVAEGFTITNTHIPEVIEEIEVTKVWKDNDDQDGIRPEEITITLYAGDDEIETLTLTAENEWSGKFENLPKFEDGKEITYTVAEPTVPEGYKATVDGFTITNTHDVAKTSVTVTKVWSDKDNQDGNRPTEITIHLLADSEDTGKEVVLNESNKWTYTWTGLDVNADGKGIVYSVSEDSVADKGYTVEYSSNPEDPYQITVTNSYKPAETSVRARKVWDDAHNQDGIRPDTVTLQLYKTVNDVKTAVGDPVEVSSAYQWTELPKYEGGKEITYSVEEKDVPEGYTVSYSTEGTDLIVKNTHAPEMIDEIAVTKVWDDADDQGGIRPDSITVTLYANGEATDKKLTLNEANKWSGDFKDLPKYANGGEIKYTVKEPTVPEGYKATVDGFTITNTHVPADTELTVTKVWADNKNQDGIRPDSITAEIYADGKVVKTVELTAENNWKATVKDLPKNADGKPIAYTVKEKNVPAGYTASVDGFTITNTHSVAKTEVSVKKLWVDENDQDGKRPASVTVGLYADGVFTGKTLVLNARNGWNAEFQDLDKFHQGKVITYTVLENVVIDYVPVYNYSVDTKDGTTHVTITNIHAIDLISIPVQKIWNDNDDQDGKRPDSITVTLYADGRTTGKILTLSADNLWTDTFVGLPKNNDGKQIEYSVLESAVADYTADIKAVNGKFIITNTHEVEKTELTAVKVWKDADDQDGKRPDEIVLHLLANGVRVDKATLNADGKWTYTWKNLDKYAAGQEITYSVYEEPVADENGAAIYTVNYKQESATKITVTNSYTPEVTAVQTQKVWEDGHDRDGLRPESITVTLLGNGEKVASVVLNEANDWTGSWTNLPKYEQGKEIQYTVAEDEVPEGYESAVALREDGQFIITNTHAPATTGVTVEKIWADENDNDGKRPDGIIVQLYADGSAVENGKIVLDASNDWAYAWESTEAMPLYIFNQGELIHYYVLETGYIIDGVEYEGLPEGYVGSTATGENAYAVSITNTRAVEKLSVSVVKVWADQDDNDGIRPDSVEMTLMKNGVAVETVALNADNNWTYTWKDLYKYAEGELVNYTVVESAVDGYEAAYAAAEGDDQITITVTNTHVAETKEVTVTKVWKDNNDEEDLRPDSVTVQLYKNGEAYGETIKLSAVNSWSYAAELPVYENGEKITWSVKEISIPRYYTVSYDQNTLTITNTIQSKDVPKSGDFNHLWMWFVLMGGATAGAATVVLCGKKKGKYAR